jgi:hypothetical protein
MEILGLMSILDQKVFLDYSNTFKRLLTKKEDDHCYESESRYEREYFLKEKIVALKCSIDGILLHGICNEDVESAFDLITNDYLKSQNRYLRQVTIEGVCKLLVSNKIINDEKNREKIEAIIG